MSYARDVVSLLWPEPFEVASTSRRGSSGRQTLVAEWLLLPDPGKPTLLVPSGVSAASIMLRRHGNRILPRIGRASLSWAVGNGVLARLPTPRIQVHSAGSHTESVMTELGRALPHVSAIGLILGTPRPNRKPVLQLFAQDGTTIGFAKVGVDDYTRRLVRTEAANLAAVHAAGLTTLEAPTVLDHGSFRSLELLVLSPMNSSQQRRQATMPWPALREIANVGRSGPDPLAMSPYWPHLTAQLAAAAHQSGGSEAKRLLERVAARWGAAQLVVGSWHGDWAPWNMGYRGQTVQLWDWERFACDVPIGFDAIHFRAQQVRHGRRDTAQRETALRTEVPHLLQQMGLAPGQSEPDLVLSLYLLDLWARFAGMTAEGDSAQMHPRARWALTFAKSVVA